MYLPEEIQHMIWKAYSQYIVLEELKNTVNKILHVTPMYSIKSLLLFEKPTIISNNINKMYYCVYDHTLNKTFELETNESMSYRKRLTYGTIHINL